MVSALKDSAPAPVLREASQGQELNVLGAPYVLKVTSAETNGSFCCIEHPVPPGYGVPPHTHTQEDEAFYVLAGEIVLEGAGGDGPVRAGPGTFLFAPRGHEHSYRNESGAEARMLVFCTPGDGMERMFTELDGVTRRSGGAPSLEDVAAVAARYGVVIAPPAQAAA